MPTRKRRPLVLKPLEEIAAELGRYPVEAFEFVRHGLQYTACRVHGDKKPPAARHVNGRQLCEGLREFALKRWGLLARTVLARWGITRTEDFGRIVFALVENGWLAKSEEDSIDDFRDVYDFASAFEQGYRIECRT